MMMTTMNDNDNQNLRKKCLKIFLKKNFKQKKNFKKKKKIKKKKKKYIKKNLQKNFAKNLVVEDDDSS